jgi:hypothetical protein
MKVFLGIVVGYVGVMALTQHSRDKKFNHMMTAIERNESSKKTLNQLKEVHNG